MRQERNQSYDQKKGSADRDVTGSKKGMPGAEIGRNSMSGMSGTAGNATRNAGGTADHGGSEGNSRERKTARNGSDSNES